MTGTSSPTLSLEPTDLSSTHAYGTRSGVGGGTDAWRHTSHRPIRSGTCMPCCRVLTSPSSSIQAAVRRKKPPRASPPGSCEACAGPVASIPEGRLPKPPSPTARLPDLAAGAMLRTPASKAADLPRAESRAPVMATAAAGEHAARSCAAAMAAAMAVTAAAMAAAPAAAAATATNAATGALAAAASVAAAAASVAAAAATAAADLAASSCRGAMAASGRTVALVAAEPAMLAMAATAAATARRWVQTAPSVARQTRRRRRPIFRGPTRPLARARGCQVRPWYAAAHVSRLSRVDSAQHDAPFCAKPSFLLGSWRPALNGWSTPPQRTHALCTCARAQPR